MLDLNTSFRDDSISVGENTISVFCIWFVKYPCMYVKTVVKKGFFFILEFKHCLYCVFEGDMGHMLLRPGKDLAFKLSSGREGKGPAAALWDPRNCREQFHWTQLALRWCRLNKIAVCTKRNAACLPSRTNRISSFSACQGAQRLRYKWLCQAA